MAKTKEIVIKEIKAYIIDNGGRYRDWYVGIASDARDRLFNAHAVKEQGDAWIYRQCESSDNARDVEDYFIALGAAGGPGGGDYTTTYVYAYKIASHTKENA